MDLTAERRLRNNSNDLPLRILEVLDSLAAVKAIPFCAIDILFLLSFNSHSHTCIEINGCTYLPRTIISVLQWLRIDIAEQIICTGGGFSLSNYRCSFVVLCCVVL